MSIKKIAKLSAKRIVVAFPNISNSIWRRVYTNLIYKGEDCYANQRARQEQKPADTNMRSEQFGKIFKNNAWKNAESVSGYGSTLYNTTIIRRVLPELLKKYEVATLLDAPCGDFNWMRHVELPNNINYFGCDIVAELIGDLSRMYEAPNRSFKVLDIIDGVIPQADIWLCRDVIFHLTLDDGLKVLENAARSDVKYFASTTYDIAGVNRDICTGAFRFINLMKPPYNLPAPIEKVDDFLAPNPPRQLGVWSSEQLRRRFLSK